MQDEFKRLIGRAYRAMIMKEGNITDLFREFARQAESKEYRAYAMMKRDDMRKVAERDFVSKVGADFIDRALVAMESNHAAHK